MMGFTWDDERAIRIEALKCRTCGGINPHICACAKSAWFAKQQKNEEKVDQEWESFKALSFPSSMKPCKTCGNDSVAAYCACAKKRWMEWKQLEQPKEKRRK